MATVAELQGIYEKAQAHEREILARLRYCEKNLFEIIQQMDEAKVDTTKALHAWVKGITTEAAAESAVSKESEKQYSIGDRFNWHTKFGTWQPFFLGQVAPNKVLLICEATGNRFIDEVLQVKNPYSIPASVFHAHFTTEKGEWFSHEGPRKLTPKKEEEEES